jgi:hypothetical protein
MYVGVLLRKWSHREKKRKTKYLNMKKERQIKRRNKEKMVRVHAPYSGCSGSSLYPETG